MPAALIADGLCKRYGRVHALRGLSFEVPEGSFYGLLGRNGAGKTTTLDIVTGLLGRDGGRVCLLGEQVRLAPAPETKARLAYVSGNIQLYSWMRCEEHIRFMSKFYPTWDAGREAALLAMLPIPLDRYVWSLSTGQYVQLQLVMALAHRPELLIVDEPGNLDAVVRQQLMRTMIDAIASEETTVIMASHIISELDGVCDHICLIHDGQALAEGPVSDIADSVRRVHLGGVTAEGLAALAAMPGVVAVEQVGGDVRAVVTGWEEAVGARVAKTARATGYEAERLGLQDLFIALTANEPVTAGRG